jgi:hypothetical protein
VILANGFYATFRVIEVGQLKILHFLRSPPRLVR